MQMARIAWPFDVSMKCRVGKASMPTHLWDRVKNGGHSALRLCPPHPTGPASIERETRRLAAEIGRRAKRLTVNRPVQVLARERWVPELRRKRVVLEFAVARQNLGTAVEPGALGDV